MFEAWHDCVLLIQERLLCAIPVVKYRSLVVLFRCPATKAHQVDWNCLRESTLIENAFHTVAARESFAAPVEAVPPFAPSAAALVPFYRLAKCNEDGRCERLRFASAKPQGSAGSHKDNIPIILANLEGHLVKTNPGAIEELASHTQGQSIAQVAGVIKVQIDYTLDQFNLDPDCF